MLRCRELNWSVYLRNVIFRQILNFSNQPKLGICRLISSWQHYTLLCAFRVLCEFMHGHIDYSGILNCKVLFEKQSDFVMEFWYRRIYLLRIECLVIRGLLFHSRTEPSRTCCKSPWKRAWTGKTWLFPLPSLWLSIEGHNNAKFKEITWIY